jgi:hypothetical protein
MANLPFIKQPTSALDQDSLNGMGYRMHPRINLRRSLIPPENPVARSVWNVFRRDKACHDGPDYNTCEKGVNTNVTNLAIILGIVYVKTTHLISWVSNAN